MSQSEGYIGVDFDGTLATKVKGVETVGNPIRPMVERVRQWIKEGREVRIVTARASGPHLDVAFQVAMIRRWLVANGIKALKIQPHKCKDMLELWDDRAVQVETDTGVVIGKSRLGLGDLDPSRDPRWPVGSVYPLTYYTPSLTAFEMARFDHRLNLSDVVPCFTRCFCSGELYIVDRIDRKVEVCKRCGDKGSRRVGNL